MKKRLISLIFFAINSFLYGGIQEELEQLKEKQQVESREYREEIYAKALSDTSTAGLLRAVALVGEGNYHKLEQRYRDDTGSYLWGDIYLKERLHTYRLRFWMCCTMATEHIPPDKVQRVEPNAIPKSKL